MAFHAERQLRHRWNEAKCSLPCRKLHMRLLSRIVVRPLLWASRPALFWEGAQALSGLWVRKRLSWGGRTWRTFRGWGREMCSLPSYCAGWSGTCHPDHQVSLSTSGLCCTGRMFWKMIKVGYVGCSFCLGQNLVLWRHLSCSSNEVLNSFSTHSLQFSLSRLSLLTSIRTSLKTSLNSPGGACKRNSDAIRAWNKSVSNSRFVQNSTYSVF